MPSAAQISTFMNLRHLINPKWYSHKFRGPGVRYEVAICMGPETLVSIHGPFPCGSHSDLRMFRLGLKAALACGEKVIADGGYRDEKCVLGDDVDCDQRAILSTVRARQETVNGRFKQLFILGHRFRHNISMHSFCFHAVANVTQLMIENGEPLFSVDYSE